MNNTEAANIVIQLTQIVEQVKSFDKHYTEDDIPIMSSYLKEFQEIMHTTYPLVRMIEEANLDKVDQVIGEALRRITSEANFGIEDLYVKIHEDHKHCIRDDDQNVFQMTDGFTQIVHHYLEIETKKKNRDDYIDHVLKE